jgi:hypothetical protein
MTFEPGSLRRTSLSEGRQYWRWEDERGLSIGLNAVAGRPRAEWGFLDVMAPMMRAKDMLSNGMFASVVKACRSVRLMRLHIPTRILYLTFHCQLRGWTNGEVVCPEARALEGVMRLVVLCGNAAS